MLVSVYVQLHYVSVILICFYYYLQLATCDLYRDFILLDARDSVTVDGFLGSENIAEKGLNNSSKGSSLKSKYHKSFSSPTGLSGGVGNKSSARKNQNANLYQSPRGHEFDPGNLNNDPFSSDIPDNIDDAHGYSEPRDLDDSEDEDPWKPLNPHEPGNLKVKSYRKGFLSFLLFVSFCIQALYSLTRFFHTFKQLNLIEGRVWYPVNLHLWPQNFLLQDYMVPLMPTSTRCGRGNVVLSKSTHSLHHYLRRLKLLIVYLYLTFYA